jgi:hypothetical protein
MRAVRAGRRCSQVETLSDGGDLRDVTGGDDSSGERGKSVEQLQELLVVQMVVGGESHAVPFGVVVVPGRLEYLARDDASCCLKDVRFTAACSGGQSCAYFRSCRTHVRWGAARSGYPEHISSR